MANYSITYSCGHTEDRQLFGKMADRERIIASAEKSGECSACYKAAKAVACEAVEAELGLPALVGSEKQIAWGRTIRTGKIREIADWMEGLRSRILVDKLEQYEAQRAAILQAVYAKTSAGWWIDNRETAGQALAQIVHKEGRA